MAQRLRKTLRTARQGAALTQEQMARRIGLAPSTYGRLERGTLAPGPATLLRLSQALCLTLDALVGTECAAAVTRASRPSRPSRRRRPARSRPSPFHPLGASDPWGLFPPPRPVPSGLLALLLLRRVTPLAFVVDMG
ncbi:MAG: helix-turn-helix transcriptional regulator [Cystobacter sp.]